MENDVPSTRERIVASARALYLEEGLGALSMRRVAERAGLGTMTTYRHFENKEALLVEIVLHGFVLFADRFYRALEGETPAERLWLCGEQYLGFALEHPRLYEAMFSLATPVQASKPKMDAALRFLSDRVRELDAAPADARATALELFSLCHGMVSLHLAGRYAPELDFPTFYRRCLRRAITGRDLVPRDFFNAKD